jgi:hypothetical protein
MKRVRRKLESHGFDIAACGVRVRAELLSRGISVERNEDNAFALLFAKRARERYGDDAHVENACGHPLWAHIESVHGTERQSARVDCKDCALLSALWLPYKLKVAQRDRARFELATLSVRAKPIMSKLRDILLQDPAADGDVELFERVEDRLAVYGSSNEDAVDPEIQQALRPGRRSNDLLRQIEAVMRGAGFSDRDVARIILGDVESRTLRSIRNRRQAPRTDVGRQY